MTSRAVQAFRKRFASESTSPKSESPETRLLHGFELHGLALWQDIERAMRVRGATDPSAVADEVNRRRKAESPIPPSLATRFKR